MLDGVPQVALMLAKLYGLNCTDALKYTQAFHDSRRYPQNVRSPQTAIQRTQVSVKLGLMSCLLRIYFSFAYQCAPASRGASMHTQVLCVTNSIVTPVSACHVCLPYTTWQLSHHRAPGAVNCPHDCCHHCNRHFGSAVKSQC